MLPRFKSLRVSDHLQHGTTTRHTLSKVHICTCRPTQRQSGPLPLSLWPGLWIQACLCSVSMAPYIGIEHKWASNQLKHSPCLFGSQAGNIHPSLSSQRPQFSSTRSESAARFHKLLLNLMTLSTPSGGAIWICDCCFFKVLGGDVTAFRRFHWAVTHF